MTLESQCFFGGTPGKPPKNKVRAGSEFQPLHLSKTGKYFNS